MKRTIKKIVLIFAVAGILTGCGRDIPKEGLELLESGKYEEAIEIFEEGTDKKSQAGESYRGMGIAYWELEKYEESKESFLKALENDAKKTATIYNFLGNCELILNNPSGALNYYKLGMSTEGCSEEMMKQFRYNEIVVYEQMGDFESAKTLLNAYVQRYTDDERAQKEAKFLETR